MARPLRLEMKDGYYHVMSRGNRRELIFKDDVDRQNFLGLLERQHDRRGWNVLAYCLMTNHYHLLVHTPSPNLSRGMRDINGIYTQGFNRRHNKVGHLLQGRYAAHVVDKDTYLMELSRYVVLNPVRARMVSGPRQYVWSSYRATIGLVTPPGWLDVEQMLAQFAKRRSTAISRYRKFVHEGVAKGSSLQPPRRTLFYGNDDFIERTLRKLQLPENLSEVSNVKRMADAQPLEWYAERYERSDAIAAAWETGAYSLQQIGIQFGLHYSSVSRILAKRRRNVQGYAKRKT